MEGYRENWHEYAKTYIAQVEKTLDEMGCFETIDGFNLDLLGDSLSLYLRAKEELDKNGLVVRDDRGRMVANPCVALVKNQQGVIIALMKELSISLRQRRFLTRDNIVVEENPLDKFLDQVSEL